MCLRKMDQIYLLNPIRIKIQASDLLIVILDIV
jgi:hypothetical protein